MPMRMPMPGMNMTTDSMDMPTMHMSFYWGIKSVILFSGWPKDSHGMYAVAFLFVLLLALAIEVLSAYPTLKKIPNPSVAALVQALVYAVRMAFAYMVMLAVMSFNLGIFIAAVVGHFLGFFLVKRRALAINNQADQNGEISKV